MNHFSDTGLEFIHCGGPYLEYAALQVTSPETIKD
jgi:hypothetical protein